MPSAAYSFYLNQLHVNSKTSPGNYVDKDVVVFAVSWNGQIYPAPASSTTAGAVGGSQPEGINDAFYVDGYIGLVEPGNDIYLCALPNPPNLPSWVVPPDTNLSTSWAIGPLNIADQDSLIVFYSVVNLSYYKGDPTAAYLKIVGGELASLAATVAVGIAVTPPPVDIVAAIVSAVIAAVGAIVALIGEVLGDLFPGQPNCNGPVLVSPALSFTGAQLEQLVNTPSPTEFQFTTTIVNSGLTSPASGKCSTPNTDVTWSIMRDITSQEVFVTTPPPPVHMKALVVSNSPEDWSGRWGDGEFVQSSRITCVISYTGNGVTGATPQDRIGSYSGGLIDSLKRAPAAASVLGQDPRVKRSAAVSLDAPAAAGSTSPVHAAPIVTARYSAAITEHLGSAGGQIAESASVQNLPEIPMIALPLPPSDIYPPVIRILQDPAHAVVQAPTVTSDLPHADEILKTQGGQTGITLSPMPMAFVASLVASADVSLHLYGVFDATNKITGYKIRYLRTSDAGALTTDVMLSPVQNIPS